MKALLVGEYRQEKLLRSTYELVAFAESLGMQSAMFLVGSLNDVPKYDGTLYLADAAKYGEFNPGAHKQLLLEVIKKENPDLLVFSHSSYGWDLAPRVALALQAGQVSEVIGWSDGSFVVSACNAKLRRQVRPKNGLSVVTLQAGAFNLTGEPMGTPRIEKVEGTAEGGFSVLGYEVSEQGEVDLAKAEIIVSAGRGIGKPENVEIIAQLATALGGELGASRPVVDAGWVKQNRQVGTTGQTVSPKLYVACGISGAIQHLAGMKNSEFVVAINTDKDAPFGEVADVLVVADVKQFVPGLVQKLKRL